MPSDIDKYRLGRQLFRGLSVLQERQFANESKNMNGMHEILPCLTSVTFYTERPSNEEMRQTVKEKIPDLERLERII